MEKNSHQSFNNGRKQLQIIRHPLYHASTKLALLDIRVFYVRISHFSTPKSLTINHIPLSPNSLLEVNGERCSINSQGASCLLRRNRADKISEEATFVCTDSIRLTDSVKFEVFHKDDLLISGVLEMSCRKWHMDCETVMSGKKIEVYIAGCFAGIPIILTKTLQHNRHHKKKNNTRAMLDSIPEYESQTNLESDFDLQVAEYRKYKAETEEEKWRRAEYLDGELSWFNAGVRVGVGIGLGICLGVGVGVGLLVRTYQSTAHNFRSRFI